MFNSTAFQIFIFAQWQFLTASVRQIYIIYKSANQRKFRDCPCGCKIHFDILLQLQRFSTQNDKAQIDKKLVMQGTSTVMNLLIYGQNQYMLSRLTPHLYIAKCQTKYLKTKRKPFPDYIIDLRDFAENCPFVVQHQIRLFNWIKLSLYTTPKW